MTLQPLSSSPARVLISGGLPGTAGASTTVGAGPPSASLGIAGDSYIDSATGHVWNNDYGTWIDSGIVISQQAISLAQESADAAAASALQAAVNAAPPVITPVAVSLPVGTPPSAALSGPTATPTLTLGIPAGATGTPGQNAISGTPKGLYDATQNIPALSAGGGGGVLGDTYTVSVAGTMSIDGVGPLTVGNRIQNTGSSWQAILTPQGAQAFSQVAVSGGTTLGTDETETVGAAPGLGRAATDAFGNVIHAITPSGTFQYGSLSATAATFTTSTSTTSIHSTIVLGSDRSEASGSSPSTVAEIGGDAWGNVLYEIGLDGSYRFGLFAASAATLASASISSLLIGTDRTEIAGASQSSALVCVDMWGNVIQEIGADGTISINGVAAGGSGSGTSTTTYSTAEILGRDGVAIAESNKTATRLITELQASTAYMLNILEYGQSLSTGTEGWPALSTTAKMNGALMLGNSIRSGNNATSATWVPLGSAVLNPLVANSQDATSGAILSDAAVAALTPGALQLGEDLGVGATNFFRTLWNRTLRTSNDPNSQHVVTSCGVGGETAAQLSKGASPELFNRLRNAAAGVKAAATAASKTYGVAAFLYLQGEADYTAGTPKATYKATVLQIGSDFEVDINQTIGGGVAAGRVPKFLYQSGEQWATDTLSIAQAQLEIANEQRDWFMVAPDYPVVDKLQGHLSGNGYRWMAMQFGKVMHRVITLGQDWSPLQPRLATFRGTQILIDFLVPEPPLVFDDPWIGFSQTPATPILNQGFMVTDSVGTLAISSVSIVGQASVLIASGRALVAPVSITYAGKTAGAGNGRLRDSDATVSPEVYSYTSGNGQYAAENVSALVGQPYPLWNWCVGFNITAVAG